MSGKTSVTAIAGDGTGPEVRATRRVLLVVGAEMGDTGVAGKDGFAKRHGEA